MSREKPDQAVETGGLDRENSHNRPSIAGSRDGVATAEQTVYRGRRDPAAPVSEELEVTVDGEPLAKRYDLLSASPSGFETGYNGSGPAQLAIAILAHAYDDEFAREWYQQFKRDVVATLPESGWTLTKSDLDEWRQEVIADA
ncbi:hypothetical protein G3I44_12155 [Halogeometricum borinquense]|uniref:Uncharacterized protein n=1 Tax=Halogeometricum borinquense TaxID=60847 RepID=A0A6C0UHI1_9EURY|nr:DUF6166 domain-containing protein [Halogeometricum borinquense]QIB74966.1 hypothetical protein G3I44_12155 [Halogeometricum borinquense]